MSFFYYSDTTSPLKGYVLNMSPIKLSKKNKPYYNLNFEVSNKKVHQAVCFSPSKRRLLAEAEKDCVGVCISNFKFSNDGTMMIGDDSCLKKELLGFKPDYQLPTKTISEILNEENMSKNINVVGVLKLEEKTSVNVNGAEIPIRRGYLCDQTESIKITLWREYADQLDDNTTYILTNVKKHIYNSVAEIQTTHTTSFRQVDHMENHVPEKQTTTTKIQTELIGAKYHHIVKCLFCREMIDCKTSDNIVVECNKCNGSAKLTSLSQNKYWVVIAKDTLLKLTIDAALTDSEMSIDQYQVFLLSNTFEVEYNQISTKVVQFKLAEVDETQ